MLLCILLIWLYAMEKGSKVYEKYSIFTTKKFNLHKSTSIVILRTIKIGLSRVRRNAWRLSKNIPL